MPFVHARSRAETSPFPAGDSRSSPSGSRSWCIAVASPIAEIGETELFSFHMTQHLLLGDLAPLCILAGLTGPLLRPILALPGVMRLRVLANPLVAFPIWTANLVLWHLPVPLRGAQSSPAPCMRSSTSRSSAPASSSGSRSSRRSRRRSGSARGRSSPTSSASVSSRRSSGNVFIWGGSAFYDVYENGDDYLGLSPGRRPEPRRVADDARGLARHRSSRSPGCSCAWRRRATCGRS